MNKFFNFLLTTAIISVLLFALVGCGRYTSYHGKKIELDFKNTVWHLNTEPELGTIKINEKANEFCMDMPVAKKTFYGRATSDSNLLSVAEKEELKAIEKTGSKGICGKFQHQQTSETSEDVSFNLKYNKLTGSLYRSKDDLYFMYVNFGQEPDGNYEFFILN